MNWKGSCWLVRWDSPFGVIYMKNRRGKLIAGGNHPSEAVRFETKERAEAAATLAVAQNPETLIGKVSVREWDGGKRYP